MTDVPESVAEFVRSHTKKEVLIASHNTKNPVFRQMTWSSRRALVEELLRLYQSSSLVITSRLHAALPCLALGTPVLLVKDKKSQKSYRFATFIPYLNHTTPEDLIEGQYLFNFDEPKANPGGHEHIAEEISRRCTEFINLCENESAPPTIDVETWLDGHKRNNRLKRIIKTLKRNQR